MKNQTIRIKSEYRGKIKIHQSYLGICKWAKVNKIFISKRGLKAISAGPKNNKIVIKFLSKDNKNLKLTLYYK